MKRSKTLVVCAMLGGSIMFSSCIGSFGLWNNLKDWNQGVSNKFVNELIFVAFHIVPVYEIAYLADVLVLNSIEFWSGSNPTASIGEVKEVKGENGEYLVKTNTDGYTITKKGEEKSVDLVYNKDNNTWNAVADGQSFELVKMNEERNGNCQYAERYLYDCHPRCSRCSSCKSSSRKFCILCCPIVYCIIEREVAL